MRWYSDDKSWHAWVLGGGYPPPPRAGHRPPWTLAAARKRLKASPIALPKKWTSALD